MVPNRRRLMGVTLFCSLFLLASSSQALMIQPTGDTVGNPPQPTYDVTIDQADVGQSFSLFSSLGGGAFQISSRLDIMIQSFTDSVILLALSIYNTSTIPVGTNAGIASLGIAASPDVTASLMTAGSVFDSVGTGSGPQQTFPGGFKGIDICVFAQNCSGGGQGGLLAAGDSDSFVLALAGDFSGGSITLSDWAVKFQTSRGSFEIPSGPGRPVPEPTAALVFAVGLLVAHAGVRRRRS